MKTIIKIIMTAGLVFALPLLHAQPAFTGGVNAGLLPVQAPLNDSIVQITAEANGLAPVPPGLAPLAGTFWVIQSASPEPEPWPMLPPGLNPPVVYALPDGSYLVDATTAPATPALLEAQAQAVVNLIGQAQTAQLNQQTRALARALGFEGLSDDDSSATFAPPLLTNLLWLGNPAVSNAKVSLNLFVPTNLRARQ